jgi:hypothetical protein
MLWAEAGSRAAMLSATEHRSTTFLVQTKVRGWGHSEYDRQATAAAHSTVRVAYTGIWREQAPRWPSRLLTARRVALGLYASWARLHALVTTRYEHREPPKRL